MRHTCDWRVLDEEDLLANDEVPCGKPAVAHITWPNGVKGSYTFWYCAEHYDKRLAFIRACNRNDVLEASGAR